MEPFRWVLLLVGACLILGIFAYSRGWYPKLSSFRRKRSAESPEPTEAVSEDLPQESPPEPAAPPIEADSKVIAVRIMARDGGVFDAEKLILTLRAAGMRHGRFGIFHSHADDGDRVRFSVASLVEPGSFDLSNIKDTEYRGVSMFMILPVPEDGVQLFDDMVAKAREITKAMDGSLTDEAGGAFSLQRERYMREDLIEYLRRQEISVEQDLAG